MATGAVNFVPDIYSDRAPPNLSFVLERSICRYMYSLLTLIPSVEIFVHPANSSTGEASFKLIASQLLRAFVEANAFEGLRLNLPNSFTGDAEFAAYFFEGVTNTIFDKSVAHF